MNIETIRTECISKAGVTEEFPFDDVTLVFKVMGKMFALLPTDAVELSISLKCDPERAIDLREKYSAITPGFHLSKKHWNTIVIDETLPHDMVIELIEHSYRLVVGGLPKKLKENL